VNTSLRLLSISVIALLLTCLITPVAHAQKDVAGLDWLEGFTLVELDSDDVTSMYQARSLIESRGGQVAILSPPSILMGWVPFEERANLIGRAHIRDIYFTDVSENDVVMRDEQTRHMVRYFNRVVKGEYNETWLRRQQTAPPMNEMILKADVKDRGPLEEQAYIESLERNGFDTGNLRDIGVLLEKSTYATAGNSDRMMGTVATTLIFVESDGSGVDPDTYTWTDTHVQDYIAGVNTGMAWWSAQARNYNDCWVAFFVRYFVPTDSRCRQWREMVLHPSGDVSSMVSDIMDNFGYTLGNNWTQVDAFNTAQRSTYGTDWAYTGFVAYNPSPAPNQLTDGAAAFAYRFGPYTFLLYRSYGWPVEQVFAHESGHIFGACDEYDGGCSSTSCTSLCANGVVNGNCEVCATSVPCMMKANTFSLCSFTDDHIGWQISPCAPTPLVPPTADAVSPASGVQGGQYTLTITGSDFLYGAFAVMGAGIDVNSNELVSSDTLLVSITIANDAVTGSRPVTVKNRDLQQNSVAGGFQVLESTRHYVSTGGSAVFPYVSPASAATTIADAFAAAADGDSILVESATFVVGSLNLIKPVTLSGGWTGGFTGRDVVSSKSTLNLSGNILVGTSSGQVVIEGFIVENGAGSASLLPVSGDYGGGVKVENSAVIVKSCEIRNNEATDGAGFGAGGGLSASGSDVTIENTYIHDNTATFGGGVFLYDCTVTMTGNLIENNSVAASTALPIGAGVVVDHCNTASLTNNTFQSNTGSQDGGGLWIKDSPVVSVSGGLFSYNDATFYGGGLYASKSGVGIEGVLFHHNHCNALGGGVALADTCDAVVTENSFRWNTAMVGGGIYFSSGNVSVDYNLFVGNSTSNSGGGVFGGSISGGEVVGNTLDRNSGGAVYLSNMTVDVYNNIVSNTTGHGIAGSGTLPVFTYNNVWNSSGDDYSGCSPSAGSISMDPLFVDTAMVDYHLGVHSPAIDAGLPGAGGEDPDGSRGDMGRYGSHIFAMDQPAYTRNLTADISSGDVVLTWESNAEPDLGSYAVYCDSVAGFTPLVTNFVRYVTVPDTTVYLGTPGDTLYYRVNAIDVDGYAGGYSNTAVASPLTAAGEITTYANRLYQNVPNPFNPTTSIRYELRERSTVDLKIYDVGGRLVRTLVYGSYPAGVYQTDWDGGNANGERVSSGIYFYKLSTPGYSYTRKMVLLK
jgi:hypothetical protein